MPWKKHCAIKSWVAIGSGNTGSVANSDDM